MSVVWAWLSEILKLIVRYNLFERGQDHIKKHRDYIPSCSEDVDGGGAAPENTMNCEHSVHLLHTIHLSLKPSLLRNSSGKIHLFINMSLLRNSSGSTLRHSFTSKNSHHFMILCAHWNEVMHWGYGWSSETEGESLWCTDEVDGNGNGNGITGMHWWSGW